jgi:alpha-ribazole phosphatase
MDAALAAGVTHRLILIRHGEPEAYARGRCYGKLDVGLSNLGREQISSVARRLKKTPLSAVYSSPRQRAYESAKIIAVEHNLDVSTDPRLCEIDFGEFEGLAYDEAAERYPGEYRAWMEQPTEVTFPGGESFTVVRERVRRCVEGLHTSHSGQIVAVISHGGVNRVILAEALHLESKYVFRLDQSYASVSIIDYYDQTPVVRLVNNCG